MGAQISEPDRTEIRGTERVGTMAPVPGRDGTACASSAPTMATPL